MRRTLAAKAVLEAVMGEPDADHYGYGLAEALPDMGVSAIYVVLRRFEREGWMVGKWDLSTDYRGPRRRYYRMTALGRREAVKWLGPPSRKRRASG